MNDTRDIYTDSPYKTFEGWLEEAKAKEVNDPNAMSLATADADGRPSCRMVLLNGVDERGFIFYTNAQSRKGCDLDANPFAALCFHWKSLRRQVRIEGRVEPVTDAESDAYFKTRPRLSRIGAWASQQSRRLPEFSTLTDAVAFYEEKFKDVDDIPRPEYWHGYRVMPDKIEFWMDGEFRLHRRYVFLPSQNGWNTHMIYP